MNQVPPLLLKEIEEYNRVAEILTDPKEKSDIYHHCGLLLLSGGYLDASLNYLTLALKVNEGNTRALETLRECLMRMKSFERVIEIAEKEIAMFELNHAVKIAIDVAEFLASNGKKKQAVEFLLNHKERLKASSQFNRFLLKFEKGVVSNEQWLEDAENWISTQGDEIEPETGLEIALIYIFRKEFHRASEILSRIVDSYPENSSAVLYLLDCYVHTGNYNALMELFDKKDIPREVKEPLILYSAMELLRTGEHQKASALLDQQISSNPSILALELKRLTDKNSPLELFVKLCDLTKDPFYLKFVGYSMLGLDYEKIHTEEAFAIFQKLLHIDSQDTSTLKHLKKIIDPEKQPEGVIRTLEVEAQLTKDKRELAKIYLALAEAYLDTGEPSTARAALKKALSFEPENLNILKLLEKVLEELNDWNGVLEIIQKEIELIQDPKEVLYLYFRAGEILEKNLKDYKEAAEYYEKVLALSPNYLPALRALRRVYESMNMWEHLVDVLQKELALTSDGNIMVELLLKSAEIYENKLNNPALAIQKYQEVLESSPGNHIAISALKRIYKKTENYDGLRNILLQEVSFVTDAVARADIWFEIGQLCENKFNDLDEALNCYTKCIEEAPGYVPAYPAIESLLVKEKRRGALKQFYYRMLEKISDREEQVNILLKIAGLSDSGDEKLSVYEQGLKISPHNPVLLDIMERLLEEERKFEYLVDILNRKIEIARNDAIKANLLFKKGIILHTHLNNPASAITAIEEAVEKNPELKEAWEWLITLCETTGNYQKLSGVLKGYASNLPDAGAIKLLLRHAALNTEHLNNPDDAIDSLESVLRIDRNNKTAMKNLYELYLKTDRIDDAIGVLSGYINSIDSVEQKTGEIKKLVYLLEKSGDSLQALNWLIQLHGLVPEDVCTIMKMEDVLLKMKKWEDLLNIYDEHLKLNLPDTVKLDIYKKAGNVAWRELKQPSRALSYLENAVRVMNEDRDSLLLLEEIYSSTGDNRNLVTILETLRRITKLPEEKIPLLRKAGKIYRELNDYNNAISVYEEITEYLPEDREALEALDELYQATSQWQKQYDVCQTLLKQTEAKGLRTELQYKLGQAQLKLNSLTQALEHFNAAIQETPSHLPSWREKCNILRKKENFPLLSKSLIELAKYEDERIKKSELLNEAATILLEKLHLEDEALKIFEESFAQNENPVAIKYLSMLLFKRANWQMLNDYSQKAYNRISEYLRGQDLADFLYRFGFALENLGKTDEALTVYHKACEAVHDFIEPYMGIARIHLSKSNYKEARDILLKIKPSVETRGDKDNLYFVLFHLGIASYQLEDFNKSIEYLESAKRLKSLDPELLSELSGVYELVNNWERCALNLEEWLTLGIMEKREMYLLRLGKIYQENLKKYDRAHECFVEAVRIKPDFVQGHVSLIDFYYAREKWKECTEQIQTMLNYIHDKKERGQWLLKLATIQNEKLNQPEKALEIAKQMINEGATLLEGYELLAGILSYKEKWDEVIQVYSKLKEIATSPEVKIKALINSGKILKEKLNKPNLAADEFKQVLSLDPENLNAHIALAEIYSRDPAKTPEAIKAHQEVISRAPDYIPSYKALGKIYENQREYDKAFCVYSVLKVFGSLDEMEKVFLNSVSSRAGKKPTTPVTEDIKRRDILHPAEDINLRQVWLTIQNELDELYPGDVTRYGVTKKDLLAQKSPIDAVIAANEVAELLGVKSFQLFKSPHIQTLRVENTSPPSIIIPEKIIESMRIEELRFVIGVCMEHIASNYVLPLKLGEEGIKKLLYLLKKSFYQEFIVPGMSEDDAQQQSKRIYKALSRRSRNSLQELFESLDNKLFNIKLNQYLKGIAMSALRTAFLFINDLTLAFKLISLVEEGYSTHEGKNITPMELMKSSEFLKDLVVYSVSNRYFNARRSLKLSILS